MMNAPYLPGQRDSRIRPATAPDLLAINIWLTLEARDGFGFIHNWELIQSTCAEGRMLVWSEANEPIAFLTNGLSCDTILQVQTEYQGRGIGRALVGHAIKLEEAANNAVLVVQCEPRASVEFWIQMGFETHRQRAACLSQGPIFMQRLSTRPSKDVRGDDWEMVSVLVYPEAALYTSRQIQPDRVHYVMGRFHSQDRVVQLARRVAIANEQVLNDPVVEITVSGLTILRRTKAKYRAAEEVGLTRTPNGWGWYLDEIYLPNDLSDA